MEGGAELHDICCRRDLLTLQLGQAGGIVVDGGRVVGRRHKGVAAGRGERVLETNLRAGGVERDGSQGQEAGGETDRPDCRSVRWKRGA